MENLEHKEQIKNITDNPIPTEEVVNIDQQNANQIKTDNIDRVDKFNNTASILNRSSMMTYGKMYTNILILDYVAYALQ